MILIRAGAAGVSIDIMATGIEHSPGGTEFNAIHALQVIRNLNDGSIGDGGIAFGYALVGACNCHVDRCAVRSQCDIPLGDSS
jgi:hypothetical protein